MDEKIKPLTSLLLTRALQGLNILSIYCRLWTRYINSLNIPFYNEQFLLEHIIIYMYIFVLFYHYIYIYTESSVVSAHVLGSLLLPLFSMNLPIQKKYGCTCHFNIASPTGKPQEQNSLHKIKLHN